MGSGCGGRWMETSRIHVVQRNKKTALESASVITVQQGFTRTRGVKSSLQLTEHFFSSLWEITWLDSVEQLFSTILVICFSNYPDIKWLFLMISAREHLDFLKTPITSGFPSTSFTSCLPLFGLKINFSPNILIFLNSEIWQGLSSERTGTHTEERV